MQAGFSYISHFFHTTRRYIRRHNHNCFELVYYKEGRGNTVINKDSPLCYRENTYVIYRPYDFHTETHDTDSFVYCLGFSMDSGSPLCPKSGLYTDAGGTILAHIEAMSQEVNQKAAFHDLATELYLNQLLVIHQREHGLRQNDNNSIQYIIRFLDENFSQNINLPTLAEMSGYSYDYFRHLFKEAVGVPPKNYIMNKRITYAKQLLIRENLPISQIALLCGFANAPQFNVIFRKQAGMSPLQYKREYGSLQKNIDSMP